MSKFFRLSATSSGEHVIPHEVNNISCRSVSTHHVSRTTVACFCSGHSQLLGTFPHHLRKVTSPSLPSTTSEIVIFYLLVPERKWELNRPHLQFGISPRWKWFQCLMHWLKLRFQYRQVKNFFFNFFILLTIMSMFGPLIINANILPLAFSYESIVNLTSNVLHPARSEGDWLSVFFGK